MTDIQIKFWQTVEAQRANRAAEEERLRSNRAQESLTQRDIAERERHNQASEDIERLRAQISAVQANAAARQAAVSERLAELNAMRYQLESTLNKAQVAKTYAERYKALTDASLARSNQSLNEAKTQESNAKTAYTKAQTTGQTVDNYIRASGQYGEIASSYTRPISDIISSAGKLSLLWGG